MLLFLILLIYFTLNSSEINFSIEKEVNIRTQNIYDKSYIITGEELIKSSGETLDEKLSKLLPGINISRTNGGYSFKSFLSMRGYSSPEQSRMLVLLDGVPLNNYATGSVNWNMVSMLDIDRIEVFKGASSFVYGSNALSGVINIITKKPDGKIKISQSYQRYNTYDSRLTASVNGNKNSVISSADYAESDRYI